jgi:hypothetical protein
MPDDEIVTPVETPASFTSGGFQAFSHRQVETLNFGEAELILDSTICVGLTGSD